MSRSSRRKKRNPKKRRSGIVTNLFGNLALEVIGFGLLLLLFFFVRASPEEFRAQQQLENQTNVNFDDWAQISPSWN